MPTTASPATSATVPSITSTTPIGAVKASANPNVGRAKQVRPAIGAGAINTTTLMNRAAPIYQGTCFAPSIATTSLMEQLAYDASAPESGTGPLRSNAIVYAAATSQA
jgi:hypothetical protein